VHLHERFRRCPSRGAKGGGRPTSGERRLGARLGKNEGEARDCFLTTRGTLGGRQSSGGDGDGEDRYRRPDFKDGGGGFGWGG
jgi:hypothetical protein